MDGSFLNNESCAKVIASLTQTIDDLRTSMSMVGNLPLDWRLTPKERALFLALAGNELLTKQMAMVVLYGAEPRQESRMANVFMSRIRRKTKHHGVKIETINWTGYRLVDRLAWVKALKLDTPVAH